MPKLHSSKEIIKVLEQKGFVFVSQKGNTGRDFQVNPKAIEHNGRRFQKEKISQIAKNFGSRANVVRHILC
ncbi:MAG: hypothetical protein WC843_06485 [Candidatus Gracilibacteria bacterium]